MTAAAHNWQLYTFMWLKFVSFPLLHTCSSVVVRYSRSFLDEYASVVCVRVCACVSKRSGSMQRQAAIRIPAFFACRIKSTLSEHRYFKNCLHTISIQKSKGDSPYLDAARWMLWLCTRNESCCFRPQRRYDGRQDAWSWIPYGWRIRFLVWGHSCCCWSSRCALVVVERHCTRIGNVPETVRSRRV